MSEALVAPLASHDVCTPPQDILICINAEICADEISNRRNAMRHHKLSLSVLASVLLAAYRLSAQFPATQPFREKFLVVEGVEGPIAPERAGLDSVLRCNVLDAMRNAGHG